MADIGCCRWYDAMAAVTEERIDTETNRRLNSRGTFNLLQLVILTLIVIVCARGANAEVNPQTTLECLPREYRYRASKSMRVKAKILVCWDDVTVYSCWGRCDSYEYGDYKIPYKVSYHPVCTYVNRKSRMVRLRRCHPDHPNPFYEVFDATACRCSLCNSHDTSCENLNG